MQLFVTQRILGLLLISFSLTLLPPLGVSLWYEDEGLMPLMQAFLVMFGVGVVFWFPVRKVKKELHLHDGFVITAVFWTVLSIVGALPFLFISDLTPAQAIFEAVSGFTTTGATVITGLDDWPKSILYYRQQLQWLGGLGIIVLAVAVLPMLGIGGMQLYRAETPGPMRDEKLTPRLENTAKTLLYIYIVLTIACALAYWMAGMSLFDAIGHSYSTVATGGFSTHDASLGYYNSALIEVIAMVFIILGSLNFTVHFVVMRKMDMRHYWYDIQGRVFIYIVLVLIAITVIVLMWKGVYTEFWAALRYGSFAVISIISSTGYATADFSSWPLFLPVLILGSGFIGGCVGSTAGGFRVIRVILLYKQALREIMRLIHPNAVIAVKIGNQKISDSVAQAVWGFIFLYMASYILLSLLFLATGVDEVTAFSGIAATLNMTGPGLGQVAVTYEHISDAGLWILSFAMLLARLEIFTLLVLLTPAFWKR
ncbi:MAG: potassium transporter [Candidatus Parabeggiatoa sp. nov. 3]|nr:MAG: potassium transporter [Gammaproteobacteria bacterium]RKZ84851.1 MAG: potassium transporter [Gammaproteobacteria bacterium]HEW98713.1 potassium transporter [Beggiatoa sp.]